MKFKRPSLTASILSMALLALGSFSGDLKAATYTFSFGSNGAIGSSMFTAFTDVGGIVEGTIELPDGDGTFLPLSILITSYSPAHGTDIFTNLQPITWSTVVGTGFTVSGGNITAANWAAQNGIENADPLLGWDQIRFNYLGLNVFTLTGGTAGQATGNDLGFAGITYTAVPEPSSSLVAAMGGLMALSFRNRRKSAC